MNYFSVSKYQSHLPAERQEEWKSSCLSEQPNIQDLVDLISRSQGGEREGDKRLVIKAIEQILVRDGSPKGMVRLGNILKVVRRFLTPEIDGRNKASMIQEFAQIAAKGEDGFLQPITPEILSILLPEMNAEEITTTLQRISKIPEEDRSPVIQAARVLIDRNVESAQERLQIILLVAQIPTSDRNAVIKAVRDLTLLDANGETRMCLVERVAKIPLAERDAVIKRVVKQLEIDFPGQKQRDAPRILTLLDTPLNKPLRPLGRNVNVPRQEEEVESVDVHQGNRCTYTRRAYGALMMGQGDLSPEDVEKEVAEFTEYLNNYPDENERKRALRTFNEPPSRFILAPSGSALDPLRPTFGPLIAEDEKISIEGLCISGKEIIARFWIFCKNYEDLHPQADQSREREIVKMSMVAALSEGVGEDGEVVCHLGKVQQLATHVLQGRLPSVQIDADRELSPGEISTLFFTDSRKALTSRLELLREADIFCADYSKIKKEVLIKIIHEYCNLMES